MPSRVNNKSEMSRGKMAAGSVHLWLCVLISAAVNLLLTKKLTTKWILFPEREMWGFVINYVNQKLKLGWVLFFFLGVTFSTLQSSFDKTYRKSRVRAVLYVPITVSPSSRLWLFRLQWPASLYATSVLSSRWLPSFSFSLFALDWLAADWFVILPADTGEEILQHSIQRWLMRPPELFDPIVRSEGTGLLMFYPNKTFFSWAAWKHHCHPDGRLHS